MHILNPAGAEMLAVDLTRDLADQFDFIYLCLDGVGSLGKDLQNTGQRVYDLKRKAGIDWSLGKRIRKIIKEEQIDLIHAHQYTPYFYATMSRSISSTPPILFTEHGRHYPDKKKLKHLLFNKLMFRKNDRVTGVGEFVKKALVKKEGFSPEKVAVIYNGVNAKKFTTHTDPKIRDEIRKELNIKDQQKIILQVARFHPVKDHATSVQAFKIYCQNHDNAVLVLVGAGQEITKIKKLATDLGINHRVRFLGLRMDISILLAAADLFVLSSLSEGISVTLLEAMSIGVPICATQVGGNSEVVLHNKTGLLSPRQDAQQLADHIATLLNHPLLAKEMATRGREHFTQLFTQEKMHHAYRLLYQQMLP